MQGSWWYHPALPRSEADVPSYQLPGPGVGGGVQAEQAPKLLLIQLSLFLKLNLRRHSRTLWWGRRRQAF